ncbi:hypothetical protein P3S68_029713 [Capsicum galapagoense]
MRSVWSQSSGICSYFWQVTGMLIHVINILSFSINQFARNQERQKIYQKRLWNSAQQGSKQTFPTFLIRRRVLMIEGGIMNDELDL